MAERDVEQVARAVGAERGEVVESQRTGLVGECAVHDEGEWREGEQNRNPGDQHHRQVTAVDRLFAIVDVLNVEADARARTGGADGEDRDAEQGLKQRECAGLLQVEKLVGGDGNFGLDRVDQPAAEHEN